MCVFCQTFPHQLLIIYNSHVCVSGAWMSPHMHVSIIIIHDIVAFLWKSEPKIYIQGQVDFR